MFTQFLLRAHITLRKALLIATALGCFALPRIATATALDTYYVDTIRTTYTGTVTTYATLLDAQNETNPLTSAQTIPDRPAVNVNDPALLAPYRDLAIFVSHNAPTGFYSPHATYLYTQWSQPSQANPNNNGGGFLQYYNDVTHGYGTVNFDTLNEAYFSNPVGSYYTQFNLHIAGADATLTGGRSWQEGFISQRGIFRSWDLNVTFSGLEGIEVDSNTKLTVATNQPTSATGTLTGIFESVQYDPGKFYRFAYTISTENSWTFDDPLGTYHPDSYFLAVHVPEPSALSLAATGSLLAFKRRRRKAYHLATAN
jgi:hypothetical protein